MQIDPADLFYIILLQMSNVMNGKEEGKDPSPEDEENKDAERAKFRTRKQVP